jgi:DNA-binding CsgD family transcriptional regulator
MLGLPGGRLTLSDEASSRAIELAEAQGDDRSLARAYAAALYLPFYTDYGRAEDLGRRAQRHAEAAGETFTRDYALLLETCSYMNRDRHDDNMANARALLERTAPRHDRFCASFALSLMLHTATLTGDVRQGAVWGAEAVELSKPLKDYFVLGTNTVNLAWVKGVAGEVDAAWRLVEPVVRSIERAGPDVDVVGMVLIGGRLRLWGGDLAGAVEWLERATRFAEPSTENWISVRAIPPLSGALRRLGRADEAVEWAQRGITVARNLGTPHAEADALEALALVVGRDDPGRAEALHHDALARRVEHGVRTYVVDSLDALAGLAAGYEQWAKAARLLAASDRARDAMGYPRLAIDRADHDALVAAVDAGLGAAARADAAAEGAAMTLDDAVAYASRSRGPRGRPVSGWASLTPTERQVAGLVAEGLTNPEIAARLFISRATVKTHLVHIYAKLALTNRVELASAARTATATPDPG